MPKMFRVCAPPRSSMHSIKGLYGTAHKSYRYVLYLAAWDIVASAPYVIFFLHRLHFL
jgi:hypothetical protein